MATATGSDNKSTTTTTVNSQVNINKSDIGQLSAPPPAPGTSALIDRLAPQHQQQQTTTGQVNTKPCHSQAAQQAPAPGAPDARRRRRRRRRQAASGQTRPSQALQQVKSSPDRSAQACCLPTAPSSATATAPDSTIVRQVRQQQQQQHQSVNSTGARRSVRPGTTTTSQTGLTSRTSRRQQQQVNNNKHQQSTSRTRQRHKSVTRHLSSRHCQRRSRRSTGTAHVRRPGQTTTTTTARFVISSAPARQTTGKPSGLRSSTPNGRAHSRRNKSDRSAGTLLNSQQQTAGTGAAGTLPDSKQR